jgi:uncharacterized protein with PIN domain
MRAQFRFYAELNDFLPRYRRQRLFTHEFEGNPSIKDMVEAIGVPHPEVDLILVNGESVDFNYHLRNRDRVSVYPVFESIDISPLLRLRPEPLGEVRFVLDTHLGRLAGYLRMFGFDTLYRNDFGDETLAQIASEQKRILLTKDRGLLKRNSITHGYFVRSTNPRDKLVEVMRRFDLLRSVAPFRRCIRCNELLALVEKEAILDELLPQVREHYSEFRRCTGCDQIYWKGTHFERMERFLDWTLQRSRDSESSISLGDEA